MTTAPTDRQTDSTPILQPAPPPTALTAESLRFRVSLGIDFQTTEELTPGADFIGQERARAALEVGLGIPSSGFNLFVSGLTGGDKLETLRNWIAQHAAQVPTPGDWVYVHNFARPDEPRAIQLEAGKGCRLKHLMADLIKTLKEELPKAFRQEAFDKEKAQLKDKYVSQAQALSMQIEASARAKNLVIQPGPSGNVLMIPVINGRPLESPEEFTRLSPEEQQRIETNQRALAEEMTAFTAKQQELMRAMVEDVRLVEKRFGDALLAPMLAAVSREMAAPEIDDYLNEVKTHIIEHLDDFKDTEPSGPPTPMMPFLPQRELFLEYDINVVVDNAHLQGAPVLIEGSPTYPNLFGAIERVVDRAGRLVTNFTRMKSGSLLRAHGGYLIFNLEDALTEPAVWKTLKRTLKSGRIEIETYEPFAMFSTSGLKPEPVRIQVKVVVVGSPMLYHMLYSMDEEFREVFKVHADFRHAMELDASHLAAYCHWVGKVCRQDQLPHFDRSGVERLVEFGSRQVGDRQQVSAAAVEVTDLVREAAFWARKDAAKVVSARHVQKALDQRAFRSNRVEEDLRRMIVEGTILVAIDGHQVGQVNGLAVMQLGEHSFGRPSRVTASVGMGQAGIVNIERESRLSGSLHDKGLLILSGYLRNRYGQHQPLALSASLCFEQSYSGIDGDSASSTELYALLSSLANVPLRQDLAVTGSVNQWGEVQAIGGANEKIEGFFDVCRVRGLTGQQGVMIPAANVRNLILRADVLNAVEHGQFHLYPIRTIDEGIELLTGVRAGTNEEDGTINGLVSRRLRALAVGLKTFASEEGNGKAKTDANDKGE